MTALVIDAARWRVLCDANHEVGAAVRRATVRALGDVLAIAVARMLVLADQRRRKIRLELSDLGGQPLVDGRDRSRRFYD